MNKQQFLEYLKDPLRGAVGACEDEIVDLFIPLLYRVLVHSPVEDEYKITLMGTTPDVLEDIHPRVLNIIESKLPANASVVSHEISKVFQMHHEYPDKWEREYFISYHWQK